jgi:SPP1 family predicted phage head-tail adaptor
MIISNSGGVTIMAAQKQAGELDRRITVQRAELATGGDYNEPQEAWTDIATVSARRADASAGEAYRAQEVGAEISTRFRVRWSALTASITPKDRVSYEGKLYNVTAVREPAGTRNQWLEIDCVARPDR